MNIAMTDLLELVRLNRRFGVLLSSGLPIIDALRVLSAEASPDYLQVILRVLESVEAGSSFTAPLRDFPSLIPMIYREWVGIGEETGTLDSGAQEVAELLEPLAQGGGEAMLGWERIEDAVALIQFTRRSAELLEKGLEWWRVLLLLTHEAPPRFGALIGRLLPRRDDPRGWLALWQRMEEHPEAFSPCYRGIVRLGWEVRALEETIRGLADLLYEDWRLARLHRCYETRPSLLIDNGAPPPTAWAALTPAQQQLATVLFCRMAALLTPLHGFAAALPVAERERLLAALEQLGDADPVGVLMAAGCFRPFLLALVAVTQTRGRVELPLRRRQMCCMRK